MTNVVTAVTTEPDHLRAFTQTGEVPRVGAGSAAGGSGAYGYGMTPGPPTGTFPVVPRQQIRHSKRAVARARRRLRAPTSLKVLTWVAAVLVLAVVAGFAIQRWNPEWLAQSHILRVASPQKAETSAGNGAGAGPTQAASLVTKGSFTLQSASYTINARNFTVGIATSGPCWVQVISADSQTPLVSGVQPAGKLLSFPAKGTMTVQVGASPVVVGITVNGKAAFVDRPHATPYTYTFTPAPSLTRPDRSPVPGAGATPVRARRRGTPGSPWPPSPHPPGRRIAPPCAPRTSPTARRPGSGRGA